MRRKLIFIAMLLLPGCATMQQTQTPLAPTDYVIAAPFEQVWSALVRRASDRSWPIKTIDKSSGVLNTDFVMIGRVGLMTATQTSDNPFAIVEDGRQTVSIFIIKVDEKNTRIKPTMHYEAFIHSLAGSAWSVVPSRGLNETAIASEIAHELNCDIHPYQAVIPSSSTGPL